MNEPMRLHIILRNLKMKAQYMYFTLETVMYVGCPDPNKV